VSGGARVTVCEVGPRDGLQNEAKVLEPALRAELVDRLADAGLLRIEVASFVRADRVPAMAGAEEVVRAIEPRAGVVYAGLVLNERGWARFASTGLDEVHLAFAVSETFNRRNSNASVAESISATTTIVELAHAQGRRATVTIATAFGCPFEGAVDPHRVLEAVEVVSEAGPHEIVLADTIGVAVPRMVADLVRRGVALGPAPIGVHLHNTRNTGYANAYAALEAGATILDASIGGVGGCPFAPRATGNIATEDLVYLLDGEGVETGIDLDALVSVSEWLEAVLGRQLEGQVYRAGVGRTFLDLRRLAH
jgi:hydroxymethylglutaryl-CoA lyase/(R)-citramalyl-CoA lyase